MERPQGLDERLPGLLPLRLHRGPLGQARPGSLQPADPGERGHPAKLVRPHPQPAVEQVRLVHRRQPVAGHQGADRPRARVVPFRRPRPGPRRAGGRRGRPAPRLSRAAVQSQVDRRHDEGRLCRRRPDRRPRLQHHGLGDHARWQRLRRRLERNRRHLRQGQVGPVRAVVVRDRKPLRLPGHDRSHAGIEPQGILARRAGPGPPGRRAIRAVRAAARRRRRPPRRRQRQAGTIRRRHAPVGQVAGTGPPGGPISRAHPRRPGRCLGGANRRHRPRTGPCFSGYEPRA